MVGYPQVSYQDSRSCLAAKISSKSNIDTKVSRTPKGTKQSKLLTQQENNNNNNKTSSPVNSGSRNQNNRQSTPLKPKSPSHMKQQPFQPFASLTQLQKQKPTSPKPIPQNKNHTHQFSTPSRYSPSSFNQHSTSPMSVSSNRSSPNSFYRSSPTRSTISPSRSSPNNFASSTCYQPPTPSSLPKPPMEWTCCSPVEHQPIPLDPSMHLKLLLNVQA